MTKTEFLKMVRTELEHSSGLVTIKMKEINDWCFNRDSYERIITDSLDEIKKMRGVGEVYVNFNGFHVSERHGSELKNYITEIYIVMKKSKEFVSLNNWLSKYADKTLSTTEVKCEELFGKRDDIEVTDTRLLCHNGNACKRALEWLRSHRGSKDKVIIEIKSSTDYGDRFNGNGEDRETEWYGSRSYYARIKILTPGGKLKCERYIYA